MRTDDDLSIARLAAKQDQNSGSLDPRAYQIELFERAKMRNTIAVLDTGKSIATPGVEVSRLMSSLGSGKTLIAVLLLKHILECELIDRAHGKRHRVAFFLVLQSSNQVNDRC